MSELTCGGGLRDIHEERLDQYMIVDSGYKKSMSNGRVSPEETPSLNQSPKIDKVSI